MQNSGLEYSVIRPTGYFSEMSEFLKMAKSGRVYLIGNGENRINPIHGADLAKVCVDDIDGQETEVAAGGPMTYNCGEIAELAFSTLSKKPKITRVPFWLAKVAVKTIKPFNKQLADFTDFSISAGEGDAVAPAVGTYTLQTIIRN